MTKTAALLLSISILPLPAFADVTLNDVTNGFRTEFVRDGNVATFPELVLHEKGTRVTMTNVRAEEMGGSVVLSTASDIQIQFKAPHVVEDVPLETTAVRPEPDSLDVIVRAPEATFQISDMSDTTFTGKLTAPNADVLTKPKTGQPDLSAHVSGLTFFVDVNEASSEQSRASFSQDSMTYTMTDVSGKSSGSLGSTEGTVNLTLPSGPLESYETPFAAIRDGMLFSLALNGAGAEQAVTAEGQDITAKTGAWSLMAALEDSGIQVSMSGTGGEAFMMDEQPKGYTYGPYEFHVLIPNFGDASNAFRIKMKSSDIALNDAAWVFVDAGSNLGHEPMNMDVDVSGTFVDNAEAILTSGVPSPNILKDIRINTLDVNGLGASLTGIADLSVSPLTSTPESGHATFRLGGVNGLLGGLVEAGILTEQQVTPVRMTLAMFTKPDGAPEQDKSVAEFKVDKGQISLNGAVMN